MLIIEVDERGHREYLCICENRRVMEIWEDIGGRSIIFIRFNPDAYTDLTGKRIKSSWEQNVNGIEVIRDKKEWNIRIERLLDEIEYWLNNVPEKMIEIVELYY